MSEPLLPSTPASRENRHEERDWDFRTIVYALAGILLLVIVSLIASGVLRHTAAHSLKARDEAPFFSSRRLPPAPRLQDDPRRDLAELRRRDVERLSTYGWVDRSRGLVRLPIERAMELVLEEGFPVRSGGRRPASRPLRLDESYGPEPRR